MSPSSSPCLFGAALLACGVAGCSAPEMPEDRAGFPCVFDLRQRVTSCAEAAAAHEVARPSLSHPGDLVIEAARARREGGSLLVEVDLAGGFRSEIDQNVHVFVGAAGSAHTRYALSSDDAYAAEVGYPVRGALDVPHGQDVRVGVMAPGPSGYSPQVYLRDPRFADAVGEGSGVVVAPAGKRLVVRVPLDRYYEKRGEAVPDRLAVTVATARDYVGFVDVRSIGLVAGDGGAAEASPRGAPPAEIPALDLDSHVPADVKIEATEGGIDVVVETRAPVRDWAQTNLHFLLFPIPVYKASFDLHDPSKTRRLPSKWSLYCGVYSPGRVFCKPSLGRDFTFDDGYSDRAELPAPDGVTFRSEGARHTLSLSSRAARMARADRPTFAAVIAIGRDGAAPTTWTGLPAGPER